MREILLTLHGSAVRILGEFASLSFRGAENNVTESVHDGDANQIIPR